MPVGLQELWDMYVAIMRQAHVEGISQLLNSKNTVEQFTLGNGQLLLIGYDQSPVWDLINLESDLFSSSSN